MDAHVYGAHQRNFQRSDDQKTVAKVFVTSTSPFLASARTRPRVRIGLITHCAGTKAEAQAFKRSRRVLWARTLPLPLHRSLGGLDDRKRPATKPKLAGWRHRKMAARSETPARDCAPEIIDTPKPRGPTADAQSGTTSSAERSELLRRIESMAKPPENACIGAC